MEYWEYFGGLAALIAIVTALVMLMRFLVRRHIERHTLPVSRAKATEMNLAGHLEAQGKALSWHSVDTVDRDVQHRGFERIKWEDESGKVWRLVNDPRRDYPLAASVPKE
jgi:hypothetical protein